MATNTRKGPKAASAAPKKPKDPSKAEKRERMRLEDRQDEKEMWDRVERFGHAILDALKQPTVLRGVVGAAAGAGFMYPTEVEVVYLNHTNLDFAGKPGWWLHYAKVRIHVFGFDLLPNVDVGSPIPGVGSIPIHVRDWFTLPEQTFRYFGKQNPVGHPDGVLPQPYAPTPYGWYTILWNEIRKRMLVYGLGVGAGLGIMAPALKETAVGAAKGLSEMIDHLIPG